MKLAKDKNGWIDGWNYLVKSSLSQAKPKKRMKFCVSHNTKAKKLKEQSNYKTHPHTILNSFLIQFNHHFFIIMNRKLKTNIIITKKRSSSNVSLVTIITTTCNSLF